MSGIIDPKGDFAERLLEQIPETRWKDVIVFDPSDSQRPLGFNILEKVVEAHRSQAASQVVAIFRKLFAADWRDRMENIFRFAILTLMEVPGATLHDIPTLLLNDEFRDGVMPHVTNQAVVDYWDEEYNPFMGEGKGRMTYIQPILTRVRPWLAYPEVANIIGQCQSSFNLRQVLDGFGIGRWRPAPAGARR